MAYFLYYLLLLLLLIENPYRQIPLPKKMRKWLGTILLLLGLVHAFFYLGQGSVKIVQLVSGILFYGLIFTFLGASKHKGIEDKVARRVSKVLTWFLLILVSFLHVFYPL
ncbi:hypothetical protein [Tepidibacillus marianensis]|uniref:hypothetical protein n=1 Tax=Tepidibacillus marianensis TaxID=3131995 RepID=UPI0030D5E3E0